MRRWRPALGCKANEPRHDHVRTFVKAQQRRGTPTTDARVYKYTHRKAKPNTCANIKCKRLTLKPAVFVVLQAHCDLLFACPK